MKKEKTDWQKTKESILALLIIVSMAFADAIWEVITEPFKK